MQALRSFYAFLDRFGLLVDEQGGALRNPALALELPVIPVRPELDWLRAEEDEALLATSMSAREDIIVLTLRMTGLRLGEALALTSRDVDLAGPRSPSRSRRPWPATLGADLTRASSAHRALARIHAEPGGFHMDGVFLGTGCGGGGRTMPPSGIAAWGKRTRPRIEHRPFAPSLRYQRFPIRWSGQNVICQAVLGRVPTPRFGRALEERAWHS
jgi:integrase